MATKETLKKVLEDYRGRECKQVELVWSDGKRAGIGNPAAIKVVMEALFGELERQMNELEQKEQPFEYPPVLTREMEMFKKAKQISSDSAIFGEKKALLEKHFNEYPIYLNDSYYAQSDKWPRVEKHEDDYKGSMWTKLSGWRDCHYYTLYEWEGHRFFVMSGGRYD